MMSLARRGSSFLTSLLLLQNKNPASSTLKQQQQQQQFPVPSRMFETVSSSGSALLSAAATSSSRSSEEDPPAQQQPPKVNRCAVVHLIVLVHGWLGNPEELSVLQQFLELQARNKNVPEKTTRILVHSATCNYGRTHDGIAAGGRRLASEINEWVTTVRASLSTSTEEKDLQTTSPTGTTRMTLSLVGNSLGGLYARYAVSEIQWQHLQPAVFVTTVTPHLGVAAPHTYVTLPRVAEYGIATVLQETGRDLFRVTNVLEQMAVQPEFVQPLRQFQRRIALANAHNTDFQVPCSTAAFLVTQPQQPNTENGTTTTTSSLVSTHYRLRRDDGASLLPHAILAVETRAVNDDNSAALGSPDEMETPPPTTSTDPTSTFSLQRQPSPPPPLSSDELARRLDALGWTKIFFDVRSHLPSMNPLEVWTRERSNNNNNNQPVTETESSGYDNNNYGDNNNSIVVLDNTTDEFTSLQLWEALGATFVPRDGRLRVPLGHQVLVANAKNERYATWTQGGRVVMEELAQWLVQEIMTPTTTVTTATVANPEDAVTL